MTTTPEPPTGFEDDAMQPDAGRRETADVDDEATLGLDVAGLRGGRGRGRRDRDPVDPAERNVGG